MKMQQKWILIAFAAAALAAGAIDSALAQEAGAHADTGKGKTFGQIWQEGGWVMYPLTASSILMVAFTAEGFFKLRFAKLAPAALRAKARELVAQGNYQEFWQTCKENPCFFSNVCAAMLERIGRGKDVAERITQEVAIKEASMLKTRNTYLSVIGVVTPMIGLSGTVTGMIKAFATLGQAGITDPAALSANISEVLIATAYGLIVAIPAFIFYYILRNRGQAVVILADSEINRLIEDIPFEELHGLKIGESFTAGQGAAAGAARKASMALTTNCPVCNATIKRGETPCHACGAVLEWGE